MSEIDDEREDANDGELDETDEGRRLLEREMWLRVLREREAEREAASEVTPGLESLFEALKKPDDPGTILEPYPARGKKPVLKGVDPPSATAPGRRVARGENFAPGNRVVIRYGRNVVECPTVLVGPGELEFEVPPDLPAEATVQVLSAAEEAELELVLLLHREEPEEEA